MHVDKTALKTCRKCNKELPLTSFYKNKKIENKCIARCKQCIIKYQTEYRNINKNRIKEVKHEYYIKNKNIISEKLKSYYKKNCSVLKKRQQEWRSRNPDRTKENNKYFREKYYLKKPEEIRAYYREYHKHRMLIDINYKLSRRLRTRLWHALKGKRKIDSTFSLIGCSINSVKKHLECKFHRNKYTKEQMTWKNYGQWHVDHIKPLASFDLSLEEEQRKAFNINNLQPLWAKENLSKGAKING